MSDNTIKELKDKSESELQQILVEQRELLREIRFKDANKQLKNIRQIRDVKKKIAHILTTRNKKEKNPVQKLKEDK